MTQSPSRSILFGASLIVAGMAIIGFIDNFVRLIAAEGGLWQFHFGRTLIAVPLLLAFCWWRGMEIRVKNPGKVAVRTLVMAAAMYLYFGSLPMMPIAQVGAALFTAPIFVLVFASVLFRQGIGPWRIFAVVLGFLGVVVILQPEGAGFSWWSLMPLASGALYGLANLLTREWCGQESPQAVVGAFFAAMGIAGLIGLLIATFWPASPQSLAQAQFLLQGWAWAGWSFWFWVAVQAVGSLVAVAFLTRGYQSGETSALSVFEYSYLVFAGFWGWAIWSEALDVRTLLGIALIVAAGAVIAWRERASQAALAVANRV